MEVALIESPDVQTIGVGEGTWPTMRSTLQQIGISERTFVAECSAAFKQGTRFDGWRDGGENDQYYHPFSAPRDYGQFNFAAHYSSLRNESSFVDAVSSQGRICDHNLAPKQVQTPEFAHVVNYGYHLDAGLFAELLKRHCMSHLGVRYISDHVTGVSGKPGEDIRAVETRSQGELAADLFIDCTGAGALLLSGHYGVGFRDCKDILFNDRALAAQVPYPDTRHPIASQTISTAQTAGWVWDIGLSTRRGVGYTYSSTHSSDEEAQSVLRNYLYQTGAPAGPDPILRKIAFRPGHREIFWHRNCLAIGMAAGFIEPLEASALVLIELGARMLVEQFPRARSIMEIVAGRYNSTFLLRWERIIDFLKLHYVLSERDDSDYWRAHRDNASWPASLKDELNLWRYRAPWHADFPYRDEVFSSASYQYVLYGMGFETESEPNPDQLVQARQVIAENARMTQQQLSGLPSHRGLIEAWSDSGAPGSGRQSETGPVQGSANN